VEIKAASVPYLEDGDATKPLPKSGSVDNLLAVWSDGPKGTELKIKLILPEGFVLPPNFITWTADDYTTPIPANSKEWTFNWRGKFGRKKITIDLPMAKLRRLIYVDVPNVGTLSEEAAKRDLRNLDKLAGLWIASEWADKWSEAVTGKSPAERNALKHSYWNALGASNVAIGKTFTLQFTTAHEYSNKVKDQGSSDTKLGAYNNTMDLFNNDVGANTAITKQDPVKGPVPDTAAIQAALLQKLSAGELMIWDGTGEWNSKTTNRLLIKSNKQKYYPAEEIIP
jgi:hypothetical protein